MTRDRLIDDLWAGEPPSTAPGVLQNYVSQLRRAYGAGAVRTEGAGYGMVLDGHVLDLVEFERLAGEADAAQRAGDRETVLARGRPALALWRGEPLADVAFAPFAQAEVARLKELRAAVIELVLESEIALGHHAEAVAALEVAVADHPFRERLWWLLMLGLHRSERQVEALRAFQRARSILVEELGVEPGIELRHLERALLDQRVDVAGLLAPAVAPRTPRPDDRTDPSLVGRTGEWSAIVRHLGGREARAGRLLLLVGEPGIGKSRLLVEARRHISAAGGTAVSGQAFEAEHHRPYGAWIDALRTLGRLPEDGPIRAGLAPLLPEGTGDPPALEDTGRLYDAVAEVLRRLRAGGPAAVLLDDLQWLDEHSASLLHFAIRTLGASGVVFVATARAAELHEGGPGGRLVQALRRDGALLELPLGPLSPPSIAELTLPIAPGADVAQIATTSNGNPLFALEMARAMARGEEPVSRLDALIGDRLGRLDEGSKRLVPWIAAYGRGVAPAVIALLVDQRPAALFDALGDLEHHGVLRTGEDGSYDFVHDLVRDAAYKRLSTPRRAMLHARIATVLATLAAADDSLAGDAARHADAGGDSATCATACARAARRCLRLLAYGEAAELAALGRTHAARLSPADRLTVDLELIDVLLHPGVRPQDPGELARDLSELCAEAQRLGRDAELSTGLSRLARAYHWGWGDIPRARALLQRAARIIESTKEPNIEPLLEGARCLAYLEIDMDRTRRLFDDLGAMDELASTSVQYQWGLGLVRAWDGDLDGARTGLGQAIELATARGEHWMAFECTARLALLELEAGGVVAAAALTGPLGPLAAKLGEGSERPYAAAITALCGMAAGDTAARAPFDEALRELGRIGARFLIPDLLGIAAELAYRVGDLSTAASRAERALSVSLDVDRPAEAYRGRVVLACIAAAGGQLKRARDLLDAAAKPDGPFAVSRHVQRLRGEAERRTGPAEQE